MQVGALVVIVSTGAVMAPEYSMDAPACHQFQCSVRQHGVVDAVQFHTYNLN